MSYNQELDAIQRWLKATAALNSYRLQETPPQLARPVVLWEAPGRKTDRNVTRYVYVKRVTQYGVFYAPDLDQLAAAMDSLETDLEERVGVLPIYQDSTQGANQVGILKAVAIEFFNNDTSLDIPFTVTYEATYSRIMPDPAPAATTVTTRITIGGTP